MKAVAALVIAIAFLAGCEDKPKQRSIQQIEQKTAVDVYMRSHDAADAANVNQLNSAAIAYQAANGKYPDTIEELKPFVGQDSLDLSRFTYDPQTGAVALKQ